MLDEEYLNKDIKSGDFRHINLFNKPFNFSQSDVIDRVNDF